jgi:REP element-mobilizing transposase RayT
VKLHEDAFVVMPSCAWIIWIENDEMDVRDVVGAERRSAPTTLTANVHAKSLGAIIRAYKAAVTYAENGMQNQRGAALWQRNYYEHVIRDEKDLQAKSDYIRSNPFNWDDDDENRA